MSRAPSPTAALALADELETIGPPPSRYVDPEGHEKIIAALKAAVTRHDPRGRLDQDWQGAVLSACGYRATSTGGIGGVCGNWIRQVRLKAGAD